MSTIKTLLIGDFTTHSGQLYSQFPLHYEHFGQDYKTAPVVLVNHSLTGDATVCGNKGWWAEIVGPGRAIDTNHFAVLAFNIPGNGVNNSLYDKPDDFHTGDIANLFYLGLQKLGVEKLFAIIGGSIGGGIAWEMVALYPNLTQHLIPVAADWKATDWIIANTFLQKRILQHSKKPLEDARIHAMLTYRTPQSLDFRFARSTNKELGLFNVESWLVHHGIKLANRFELKAYEMMNHLLASIDITRARTSLEELISNVTADIHLIAIDSDIFFTPAEDQKTFQRIKAFKENIHYHEIESIHGHDAFLIENQKMSQILKRIFNPKKIKSSNEN